METAGIVDETKKNLISAKSGETEEFTEMYPNFITDQDWGK